MEGEEIDMNPFGNEFQQVQVENINLQRIQGVNKQMKDINTTMATLNTLTSVQQSGIDTLEYNYQRADDYTTRALGEIDKADKYQQRGRGKYFYMIVGLVILLVFLILIVLRKVF